MCWDGILGTTCHRARGTVCPAAAVSPGAAEQPLQQLLQQQQQSLGCRGGSRGGEQAAGCVVDLLGVFSQVRVAAGRLGTRRGGWGSPTMRSHPAVAAAQCRLTPSASPHSTNTKKNERVTIPQRTTMLFRLQAGGQSYPRGWGEAGPGQCVRLVLGFSNRISH